MRADPEQDNSLGPYSAVQVLEGPNPEQNNSMEPHPAMLAEATHPAQHKAIGPYSAVQTSEADTLIVLDEWVVTAKGPRPSEASHSVEVLDGRLLASSWTDGLGRILSMHTGLLVREYGAGMLATGSYRGSPAGHTTLLWNGFPLQNPMSGQTDLSLIPAFFTDEVAVKYGGGGSHGIRSGAGVIHLRNTAPAQSGLHLRAGLQGADLGDFAQSLQASYKTGRLFSRLRVFNRQAANRYSFMNTTLVGNPVQRQESAGMDQYGILHETHFRIRNSHRLDIRWWWQESSRHIPPPLMQAYNKGMQEDDALRLTAQWQSQVGNNLLRWQAGYFDERLLYLDSLNGTSRSQTISIQQGGELTHTLGSHLLLGAGIHHQWVRARAKDLMQAEHQQHILSAFASLRWEAVPQRLTLYLDGQQEFTDGQGAFLPSMGLRYMPISQYYFNIRLARVFRQPSLNDKYWQPGGNPDLKAERGWRQEASLGYDRQSGQKPDTSASQLLSIQKLSLTAYHSQINEQIIWVPTAGAMYWSPQNLMRVQSHGIESRLEALTSFGHLFAIGWKVRYDYNRARNTEATSANDASPGKQLIYVPGHRAGIHLLARYGRLQVFADHQYTGRRYISRDNSHWLEGFHTSDAGLAWQWQLATYPMELRITVHNLLNQAVELMPGRPMPLRHYRASIHIDIITKK